jgi:hypothetical protein
MRAEMESNQASRVICAIAVGQHPKARQYVVSLIKSHLSNSITESLVLEVRMRQVTTIAKLISKILTKVPSISNEIVAQCAQTMIEMKIPSVLVDIIKGLDLNHPEISATISAILGPLESLVRSAHAVLGKDSSEAVCIFAHGSSPG